MGFGASPVDGAVPRPQSLSLCEAKRKPKAPPRSLRGAGEVPRANRPPERPATPGPGHLWQVAAAALANWPLRDLRIAWLWALRPASSVG